VKSDRYLSGGYREEARKLTLGRFQRRVRHVVDQSDIESAAAGMCKPG
jgi:hypothetical protein